MVPTLPGRHWIGGKRGEILRAPLKTLGIWRISYVGIVTKKGEDQGSFLVS